MKEIKVDLVKNEKQCRIISIPIHPEDAKLPISLVHIQLSKGKYAAVCGPLGYKTITALEATLIACKDSLVKRPKTPKTPRTIPAIEPAAVNVSDVPTPL